MTTSEEQTTETSAFKEMNERLRKIADNMEKMQIADYVQLLNRPRKLIAINLVAGIARGVGIAIGVSVFAGTFLYLLQQLGALNLPIIGDYIAQIVKIVQLQLQGGRSTY